jgi:DeoR family suf operon transcriptional repressor
MGSLANEFNQDRTLPLGYSGVRGSVLAELKRAERLTTKELAARLALPLNTVRHHLKELEEQDLVHYQRQQRGVGAPSFAYRLTASGEALFPRRYETVLTSLLEDLVSREGRAGTVAMLEARYTALAQQLEGELGGTPGPDRLRAIAKRLSDDGYMAEAIASSEGGTLIEHNCAIQAIAERFPEICAAEARFLGAVLGGEIHRERHILNGCSACEYRVHFNRPDPAAGATFAPSSEESA